MSIQINGSGSIAGLAVGGVPDGTMDPDTLALAAKPIGVGQAWTDQSARVSGTPYTNSTGRPIMHMISVYSATGPTLSLNLNGVSLTNIVNAGVNTSGVVSFILPAGHIVTATWTATSVKWAELS
jgi:hypothetical protein